MPMLAGVGLLVVCCSSSSAMMMMGGGEETPAATGAGGGGAGGAGGGGGGAGGGSSTPTGVSGQYVELAFPEGTPGKYNLTPHEIYVYDAAGTNMALNSPVEVSSIHGGPNGSMTGPMAVDGDEDTFWHSTGGTSSIKIDLGAVKEIAKIKIKNNEGTREFNGVRSVDRMSGGKAKITIYGADDQIVKSTPEISTPGAARYTIDLTASSPVWT